MRRGVKEAGREKDLTSGALWVAAFVLLLSSWTSDVSSLSPDSGEGFSVSDSSSISDESFSEQLLLELDSSSSDSTSAPEPSEELDSPSTPFQEMALCL